MPDIKSWIIGKLDVDGNGKVRLADAEAKFGQAFVRGFMWGGGSIGVIALLLYKLLK